MAAPGEVPFPHPPGRRQGWSIPSLSICSRVHTHIPTTKTPRETKARSSALSGTRNETGEPPREGTRRWGSWGCDSGCDSALLGLTETAGSAAPAAPRRGSVPAGCSAASWKGREGLEGPAWHAELGVLPEPPALCQTPPSCTSPGAPERALVQAPAWLVGTERLPWYCGLCTGLGGGLRRASGMMQGRRGPWRGCTKGTVRAKVRPRASVRQDDQEGCQETWAFPPRPFPWDAAER